MATSSKAMFGGKEQGVSVRGGTRPTHCVRCGRRSFHLRRADATYNWRVKAIRRKTTETGPMRDQAAPRKKGATAPA
ncbi:zinc-binding ribosomal protein family protein [Actinidia rufa]|uniref:Zinc-binding ribosomal protein family protein n=1 Tax=Actinidia rufa TaxID=165716 RepID=A0A7J0DL72_9ERIC|nr:zinc-binding ribosomal protein family protein [Actinidia rufa]